MARILSDESTLTRKRRYLSRESDVLKLVMVAEAALAAVLLLAGGIVFLLQRTAGLLVAAGVAAFLCVSHFFKVRENLREHRFVSAGLKGELDVTHLLEKSLGNDTYILNDVNLKEGRNTAQIDHLVVSPRGIFVLETKNWRGEIRGDEQGPRWEQVRTPGARPVRLSNPVQQNRRHVDVLRARLESAGIAWPDVHSVIVMKSPSARWAITGQTVPILTPEGTAGFIAELPVATPHAEAEVDAVINLLMGAS